MSAILRFTTLEGHMAKSPEFGLNGGLVLISYDAGAKLWTVDGELIYTFDGDAKFSSDEEMIVHVMVNY